MAKTIKATKIALTKKDNSKDYDDDNVYSYITCKIIEETNGIIGTSVKTVKIDKKIEGWDQAKPELASALLSANLISEDEKQAYLDKIGN